MKIDFDFWKSIKGFMGEEEAKALYRFALKASQEGPLLEIGSYCGKSAYIIGCACEEYQSILYSVDHHRGSEEQQPGEEYYDPDLYDSRLSQVNTLPFFQKTIQDALLEQTVVPVAAASSIAGKMWRTPLSLLFIDGGHAFEIVYEDFLIWACHIQSGGYLIMHDIFMDPEKGGQAPRKIYEMAIQSGDYDEVDRVDTLGVLQKK